MAETKDARVAGWVLFPPEADLPDWEVDEGAIFSVRDEPQEPEGLGRENSA